MLIPKLFYGKTSNVKQECKILARKSKKEGTIQPYINLELADTSKNKGLIVLSGPNSLIASQLHFHTYIWLFTLSNSYYKEGKKIPTTLIDEVFQLIHEKSWAFLAFLSPNNVEWTLGDLKRIWPAIVKHFDVYDATGKRFLNRNPPAHTLWEIPTIIGAVMVRMGVPEHEFKQKPSLPYSGLALPPFWHLVEKYKLPTDFPPYVTPEI